MLRFHLGRIPVTVHGSHLLVALLLAYFFTNAGTLKGIDLGGDAVRRGDPGFLPLLAALMAVWVVIIFVSVLVHELGHAVTSRLFGYRPQIHLAGMGGHTLTEADAEIPWHKQVALTFAGPAAGAALGGLAYVLALQVSQPLARYALTSLTEANIVWAVFNLLPVTPMDGSHIVAAVSQRVFGGKGIAVSAGISLAAGVVLAFLAYQAGWPYPALFLAFGAVQSFRELSAFFRGDPGGAAPGPSRPLDAALAQAEQQRRQGDLVHATANARAVLDAEGATPDQRARAQHLLGWIALGEGDGRRALDHFSQVQRLPVEKEALAMAFALVGDDARAEGFWELAHRDRAHPTIAHEWAATLLRLGREDRAQRIPQVELPTAYRLAARVQFLRREYPQAARSALRSLELRPSQQAAYDAACAFAQAGAFPDALAALERAQALGFTDGVHASTDPDLAPLRGRPEFDRWLASLEQTATA